MTIEELNTQIQEYVLPKAQELVMSLIRFYADCVGLCHDEDIDSVISRVREYDTYNEMGIPISNDDVKIFICDNMGKYYNMCSYSEFKYFIKRLNPHDLADYTMNEFHRNVRTIIKSLTFIKVI